MGGSIRCAPLELLPVSRTGGKSASPKAPIKYFFEHDDKNSGDLEQCLKEMKLPYSITPKTSMQDKRTEYVAAYQPADFIAWENRAALARLAEGSPRKHRESLEELYMQIPTKWTVLTGENFVLMCNAMTSNRDDESK